MTCEQLDSRIYAVEQIASMDEAFGPHAKARRELIGLSQAAVALIMQVDYGIHWHQTVLSKIEAGQRIAKLKEAYALANIYAIHLDDLVLGSRLDHEVEKATERAVRQFANAIGVEADRRSGNLGEPGGEGRGKHPEEA